MASEKGNTLNSDNEIAPVVRKQNTELQRAEKQIVEMDLRNTSCEQMLKRKHNNVRQKWK